MQIKCPSCSHIYEADENTTESICPECGEEVILCSQDTTKKARPFVVCQNCFVRIEYEGLSPFDTIHCPICGAEIEH